VTMFVREVRILADMKAQHGRQIPQKPYFTL